MQGSFSGNRHCENSCGSQKMIFLVEKILRFFFGKSESYYLALSLTHIGENWKVKKHYDCYSLISCLNTNLIPEMNSTHNFTIEINFWWPPTEWGLYWGRKVKNRGPGRRWRSPLLLSRTTFSTVGGTHPWGGHPKFISRVKLCVEFISGLNIVFRQFISEKK